MGLSILRYGYQYLMAPSIKVDITAMPIPLPDTMKISTNSRLRLKYCATINVEQSLVMPTPIPEKLNKTMIKK